MLRSKALAESMVSSGRLRFVLASKSPRRSELLARVLGDIPFAVEPSTFAEDYDKAQYKDRATDYVTEYSVCKAEEVAARLAGEPGQATILIGCDTVVVHDGMILEKPATPEQAKAMLRSYSGRSHSAVSGATVMLLRDGLPPWKEVFSCTTEVHFGEMSDAEIDAYVATGDPMDKAGAYGIQGPGGVLVESVNGCFYNVMGLPMHMLSRSLHRALEALDGQAQAAAAP